jgi:hypothetical protein
MAPRRNAKQSAAPSERGARFVIELPLDAHVVGAHRAGPLTNL